MARSARITHSQSGKLEKPNVRSTDPYVGVAAKHHTRRESASLSKEPEDLFSRGEGQRHLFHRHWRSEDYRCFGNWKGSRSRVARRSRVF